jgi:antitoxin component of MazEF toxin-antitoxin module
MRFSRRLSRNGHSTTISLPAPLLKFLRWQSGDSLVLELTEHNTVELRPFTPADARNTRISSMTLSDGVEATK